METKLTPLVATALVFAVSLPALHLLISVDGGVENDLLLAASEPAAQGAESKVEELSPLLSPVGAGFVRREDVARRSPEGASPGSLHGRLHSKEIEAGRSVRVVLHLWNEGKRAPARGAGSSGLRLTGTKGAVLRAAAETRVEQTDGDGRFHFGGLSPGVYGIEIEPRGQHLLSYGEVELGPGETLDLGELRIGADHAWVAPRPKPIRLDRNGDLVAGTGAEELRAMRAVVRMTMPSGKLNVCPPYHPYLARGQALQYVLESPVLSGKMVRCVTEIGGLKPQSNTSVTHTPSGCIFHDLTAGEYSVKVTLLLKDARGRWMPTGLRSKGIAKVLGGQAIAVTWNRK